MLEFELPWMFALLPLPLLVRWWLPAHKHHQDAIRVPFFQQLVRLTGQKPGKGAVILERVLFQKLWLPVSWVLLVIALASPLWVGAPIEQSKSARDLMAAVDLSGSMETQDFKTPDGRSISRLTAVKQVLAEFSEQRPHDRLGLIVFADAAYLQAPFTEDHHVWRTLLEETEIGMAGLSTMIGDAIGLSIKLFEGSTAKHRTLIVLTDGNDTGSKVPPIEAAKVAQHKQVRIYTIAVGNPESVGEEALDLDTMKAMASLSGGHFYQAMNRSELEQAYLDIAKLEPEVFDTLSFRPRHSLFHYPLAVIMAGYLMFFVLMTWRMLPIQKARHGSVSGNPHD